MSAYAKDELEQMKVPELRALLRTQNLKASGLKAELINRLLGLELPAPASPRRRGEHVVPSTISSEIETLLQKTKSGPEWRRLIKLLGQGAPIRTLNLGSEWKITNPDLMMLADALRATTTLEDLTLALRLDEKIYDHSPTWRILSEALRANRSIKTLRIHMITYDLNFISPVLESLTFTLGGPHTGGGPILSRPTSLRVFSASCALRMIEDLRALLRFAPLLRAVDLSHSVYSDASIISAFQLLVDNPNIAHLDLGVASYWVNMGLDRATVPITLETGQHMANVIMLSPQLTYLDLSGIKMSRGARLAVDAAIAARPDIVYNEGRRRIDLRRQQERGIN